jgi:hypothetical protein
LHCDVSPLGGTPSGGVDSTCRAFPP